MAGKSSILIAESKPFLANVIKESFGREFECICVRTEEEVFGMLGKADAAVVGLDVCPGEQKQRMEMIKAIKEKRDIPLVALTSIQYSSVRIELLLLGADDVMTKPFNPDELVVRVKKLLSRCR